MPNVTKEEWLEWKNHPVTIAQNSAVRDRIEEATEQILGSFDPDFDRFLKGMVRAFNEVLEAKPDIIEEDNEV